MLEIMNGIVLGNEEYHVRPLRPKWGNNEEEKDK
jgi:hypothetical protein|tara:strand:- start:416 stop:517 length:102 start_codon:yes stop_codon:yes gene_type:complete